jgi:predicted PurR-regulated permease PerM
VPPSEPAERTPQVAIAPRTIITFVVVVLVALLLLALAYSARVVLIRLVVAVVLAMALEPAVRQLQGRGIARGYAVAIAFTLTALGVAAFGYLLIPPLVGEVSSFARHVPAMLQTLTEGHGALGFLERRFHVVERARVSIAEHGGATLFAKPALRTLRGVLSNGAAAVTVAFLTLFVALGGRAWFETVLQVVPDGSRERWRRAGRGVADAVGGYVAGNVLISLIAGSVTTVILLAAHVPYPVPLGLIVALLDLLPLVGATIGAIIVGAAALSKGVPTAVIVVAAMIVYQQIENNVLQPLVYHRTVQVSALAVTVSVAAGAEIGGIVGALLGIPVAGALKVVSAELLAWRRGEDPPVAPPRSRHTRWRRRSAAS